MRDLLEAADKKSALTAIIKKLAALRDAKRLTRKEIDAANKELGSSPQVMLDNKGGFSIQFGFLPDQKREAR